MRAVMADTSFPPAYTRRAAPPRGSGRTAQPALRLSPRVPALARSRTLIGPQPRPSGRGGHAERGMATLQGGARPRPSALQRPS